jgi:hypothetical protein
MEGRAFRLLWLHQHAFDRDGARARRAEFIEYSLGYAQFDARAAFGGCPSGGRRIT